MLPRHQIRIGVGVFTTTGGVLVEGYTDARGILPGVVVFGFGLYWVCTGVMAWVGWLAYRWVLRRRGVDPDDPPPPAAANCVGLNQTRVFARPFVAGRASVPYVSRRSGCGCGLDPATGRVRHGRRCPYRGRHWRDTVQRIDPGGPPAPLVGEIVDAEVW